MKRRVVALVVILVAVIGGIVYAQTTRDSDYWFGHGPCHGAWSGRMYRHHHHRYHGMRAGW